MTILYPHYSFKTKNAINTPCREFIQVPFTACFYVFMPMLWCFWMFYGNVSSACCIFTVLVHFRLRGISLVGDIETSFHDMSNFLNFGRFERFAYTSHNNMLTSYTAFICEESSTKKCNLFQIKDVIGLINRVPFLNF